MAVAGVHAVGTIDGDDDSVLQSLVKLSGEYWLEECEEQQCEHAAAEGEECPADRA